jgi:hypothetical protein
VRDQVEIFLVTERRVIVLEWGATRNSHRTLHSGTRG